MQRVHRGQQFETDVNLRAANCAHEQSHAQFREDVALLPTLLATTSTVRPGTFVELGAFDGSALSNTWMLEKCMNWTGVLIEANPTNFAKLKKTSRRNTVKVHSAVCASDAQIRMVARGASTTGQVDALTEEQLKRYYSGRRPHINDTVSVPCRSLASIMASAGHREARFLSLDVEGAEALVLSTVDPAIFDVIMVETQAHDADARRRIDELVMGSGKMRRATSLWVPFSTVYVRQGVREVAVAHRSVRSVRGAFSTTYRRPSSGETGSFLKETGLHDKQDTSLSTISI